MPAPHSLAPPTLAPQAALLFSVACATAVANLYYAQPLLSDMAMSFSIADERAGFLVTATQIGYALGLLLIVPLGDTVNRRKLILRLFGLASISLVLAAFSGGFTALAIALALTGLVSCSAQVLVPFAASLSPPEVRGRVIGVVMSGLLIGILLARTVSGIIASFAGWRAVYLFGAIAMVLQLIILHKLLPDDSKRLVKPFGELMRSVMQLALNDRLLRTRSLLGALGFGAFSVLWTGLTFVLSAPPYRFDPGRIGLFGLAGVAGAFAATRAGKLADGGHTNRATGIFGVAILLAFLLLGMGKHSLPLIVVGIIVLDIGVQGLQITNQSILYRRDAAMHGRITTVYLTIYFIGGAIGSSLASIAYSWSGWLGVTTAGASMGGLIVLIWLLLPHDA